MNKINKEGGDFYKKAEQFLHQAFIHYHHYRYISSYYRWYIFLSKIFRNHANKYS